MDNNILYQLYLNLQNLITEKDSTIIDLKKCDNDYYKDKYIVKNLFNIKYSVDDNYESIYIKKNAVEYLNITKSKKQKQSDIYFNKTSYLLYSSYRSEFSTSEANSYKITVEDVEYLLFILLKKEYEICDIINDLFENNLKNKNNQVITAIDGLKFKARDLKLGKITNDI